MKTRIAFYLLIGLSALAFGLAWYISSKRDQEPVQVFPAMVSRDCAPWDGAAFTVSIPYEFGSVINISIWQSPDISASITYSFPDQSGSVGNAIYQPKSGSPEQLFGKVSFRRVGQEKPIEGEFQFVTEAGQQFAGKFKAEWNNQPVYCG